MQTIKVKNKILGDGQPSFIIAEVGSNYDGKLEIAKKYIDEAARIGADAVKFQTIKIDKFLASRIREDGKIVENEAKKNTKFLSIPDSWYPELFAYAESKGLIGFSTPFDIDSVVVLTEAGMPIMKIASGDVTNLPLIKKVGETGKPTILSTGFSTMEEVKTALSVFYSTGNKQIIVLHCVSTYPTEFKDVNLRAMVTLGNQTNVLYGLSDHTPGLETALGAIALGACIIEKHITFSRDLPGTDHFFAMEIPEFETMIKGVRNLELALGTGEKKPTQAELNRIKRVRRGLYLSREIKKGDVLSHNAFIAMRPQLDNIKPNELDKLSGMKAPKDYQAGDPICWDDFQSS